MKSKYLLLFALGLSLSVVWCQERPKAQIAFTVVSDAGVPVEGAEISAFTFDHWQPSEGFGKDISSKTVGTTDKTGEFVLTAPSVRGDFTYHVSKPGFYISRGLKYKFLKAMSNQWQPWNPSVKTELLRIIKPIPLCVKRVVEVIGDAIPLPAFGIPVGYDFEVGDWIAPYGKGKISDIRFQLDGKHENLDEHYDAKLSVTFSNPQDGLILQEATGSTLRLPHQAPENGYKPDLVKRKARLPVTRKGVDEGVDDIVDDTKPTENYFLRIRTVVNEKGEIVSANYAKIHGPFEWYPNGKMRFQYYFNPTANYRNLEFDPARNLLNVSGVQKVTEP